jgi:hypothetical protein
MLYCSHFQKIWKRAETISQEGKKMMTLLITLAILYVTLGLTSFVFRVSFGLFKVLFSVGLLFVCPVLFIIALATGLLHSGWFWILLILFICFGSRRRTV